VDPVPDALLFFLVVPGIEPGPPDLYPRTLTTRPQRRSSTILRDVTIYRRMLTYLEAISTLFMDPRHASY
jgi:hypothetical protein